MKLATVFASAMLLAGASMAQPFPSKTVRLISGTTPGSATDTVARAVAERLQLNLGQTVIVENRLGAGGLRPPRLPRATRTGTPFSCMPPRTPCRR
jgi:tripartite-type tricarboxylate transporter receptor subunit TctC